MSRPKRCSPVRIQRAHQAALVVERMATDAAAIGHPMPAAAQASLAGIIYRAMADNAQGRLVRSDHR